MPASYSYVISKNTKAFLCTFLPLPTLVTPKIPPPPPRPRTYVCCFLEVGCHTCLKYNESLSSRHPWVPNTPPLKPAWSSPCSEPSYMSQIIRCGGLSTKSLTLSEMTGPRVGRAQRCGSKRRTCERWEYRMVNKGAGLHPIFPFLHRSPLHLLCFIYFFPFDSSLFHGTSERGKKKVQHE